VAGRPAWPSAASWPSRAAYLTEYAERFELPIQLNSRVQSVRARDDGGFLVELADRTYEVQMHSSDYRSPADLPAGAVLVVGGGNTGYQIAAELARSHEVHLAVGARQMPLPQRIRGRDLFRYLEATGLTGKTVTSRIGRRMQDRQTLIGSSPRGARKPGIRLLPRATEANGAVVTFADGSRLAVHAVVWATGYRLDHSFVELPIFEDRGRLRHQRGVTEVPGSYFLGLPWQHTRGSALLGWVQDDAQFIAQRIADAARPRADAAAPVASAARDALSGR